MQISYENNEQEARHTPVMQDIMDSEPVGLLRWSSILFFGVLVLIAALSVFIHYPDIVNAQLQIVSPNSNQPTASANEYFLGEMAIAQNNRGKIKTGQQVLIKLRDYPFEKSGIITGVIKYISTVPNNDGVFIAKVNFTIKNSSYPKKPVQLKQGITADAQIITQDATILQRISKSLFKIGY